MLLQMTLFHSFLWLSNILFYIDTTPFKIALLKLHLVAKFDYDLCIVSTVFLFNCLFRSGV